MNTLIVVQARVGSSRLPGKVLLPLAGRPLLARMIERVRAARVPAELCIATTDRPEDEPVRAIGRELGVPVLDGHPTDLLDRHYRAARRLGADVVVKIPSDCPLIDPGVIERVLGAYLARASELDFVSNLRPPSWPDGNDVEVMPFPVLEAAWREATDDFDREHTTPFIWSRPERFRVENVSQEAGPDYSKSHRFTIDYPEDYTLIDAVYRELWRAERPIFGLSELLELLERRPELRLANARFHGRTYCSHREERTNP